MVAILRRPYHAIQNSLPVAIKVADGPGRYVCVFYYGHATYGYGPLQYVS